MQEVAKKSSVTLAVWILIIFMAFLAGWWFSHTLHHKKNTLDTESLTATVLDHARPISDFNLVDQDGKPFTKKNFEGHWNIVFFGFTRCPYICPMTMREIEKSYSILQKNNEKPFPQVVMISVDPKRDTPENMGEYVKAFNKDFVGVTGDSEQLKKLSKQMGVVSLESKDKNNGKTRIDHSGVLIIVNPQAEIQGFFSMPHKAKILAREFVMIRNNFA